MNQLGLKLKAKPIKIRGMTRDNKNDINKDLTIYGPASTVQIRKKYEADSHGEVAFYRYRPNAKE